MQVLGDSQAALKNGLGISPYAKEEHLAVDSLAPLAVVVNGQRERRMELARFFVSLGSRVDVFHSPFGRSCEWRKVCRRVL